MYWIPKFDTDTYADDQKEWLCRFLNYLPTKSKNPKLWLDIGAHKGDITEILERYSGQDDKIWAFDPAPKTFNHLCQRFADHPKIKIWNLAISDYVGNGEFYIKKSQSMSGSNFLEKSFAGLDINDYDKINCMVSTIDNLDIPEQHEIPFIKIDAEGHDLKILLNSVLTLTNHRPYILFEFSGMLGSNIFSINPKDLYFFLKNQNYHLRSIVGGNDDKFIYSHYKIETPELHDLLAVPNEKSLN